jgi:uridine kinase
VVLCAPDPLTGEDHRATTVDAPPDAVLIVDSVFAFRPEYNDLWDFRIWLDVEPEVSLARGIARDTGGEGVDGATRLHRDRETVDGAPTDYLEASRKIAGPPGPLSRTGRRQSTAAKAGGSIRRPRSVGSYVDRG